MASPCMYRTLFDLFCFATRRTFKQRACYYFLMRSCVTLQCNGMSGGRAAVSDTNFIQILAPKTHLNWFSRLLCGPRKFNPGFDAEKRADAYLISHLSNRAWSIDVSVPIGNQSGSLLWDWCDAYREPCGEPYHGPMYDLDAVLVPDLTVRANHSLQPLPPGYQRTGDAVKDDISKRKYDEHVQRLRDARSSLDQAETTFAAQGVPTQKHSPYMFVRGSSDRHPAAVMLDTLLAMGANRHLNYSRSQHALGSPPLLVCIHHRSMRLIHALLDIDPAQGLDVNSADDHGFGVIHRVLQWNPICHVTSDESLQIRNWSSEERAVAMRLIRRCSDVTLNRTVGSFRHSPLQWAIGTGNLDFVRMVSALRPLDVEIDVPCCKNDRGELPMELIDRHISQLHDTRPFSDHANPNAVPIRAALGAMQGLLTRILEMQQLHRRRAWIELAELFPKSIPISRICYSFLCGLSSPT